ncbi:unnamed protein product [Rhizopus microsporus]
MYKEYRYKNDWMAANYRMDQAMDFFMLLQARVVDFTDLSVKKGTVHNFLKAEYNFSFRKLTTQPAARNSPAKIQERMNWVKKWTATDMNYLENCIFVDESGFNINMRSPSGWSLKG